jgi:hypothetical protein
MTHSPYLLFHQTPAQLRRVAARGGRASARNRRRKMRATAPPPSAVSPTEPRVGNLLLNGWAQLFSAGGSTTSTRTIAASFGLSASRARR